MIPWDGDYSVFYRDFVKYTNKTPTEYVKMLRTKK